MEALDFSSDCLFDDVEKLPEMEHELEVVSRGDPEFQARKIRHSGVLDYVEGFTVLREGPKDRAVDIDALVDDREEELERTSLSSERTLRFRRENQGVEDIVQWAKNLDES